MKNPSKKRTASLACYLTLIVIASLHFFIERTASAQERKPILVLFHGIRNTSDDMAEVAQAASETELFTSVVRVNYDWKTDVVPNVAPRLFGQINKMFPNTNYVFYGYSKGGLVAEWITERVRAAEGRVDLVITVDSPLDGAKNLTNLYNATASGLNPFRKDGETILETYLPGLKELESNSNTIRALKSPPLNNLSSVDFIRVWGKDDKVVEQDSALRKPPRSVNNTYQVIVRTTSNSADHRDMRTLLAKYKNLLAHILSGNLPPESTLEPIEFTDEKVFSERSIPEGWVPCTCPNAHAGLGIWFDDTMYHDPRYLCPK